jgi:hypothetical protein
MLDAYNDALTQWSGARFLRQDLFSSLLERCRSIARCDEWDKSRKLRQLQTTRP